MSQEGLVNVINSKPQIPTTFVTNSGTATPIGNVLEVLGAGSVSTTGVGNVITITATNVAETFIPNSGGNVTPNASNQINLVGDGTTVTVTGNPGTNTLTISAISGSGVVETLTGNSGGAISPSAGNINTVGTGSITIVGSGNTLTTQLTGLTNHAILVGAGTATISKVGPTSTSGQILQSQGASSDPAFSTATYPSTATSTGTILRADGTNWSATSATYPNTTTINQILYSSSANVVAGLATANNGVLTTGTGGAPVITPLASDGQLIIGSSAGAPAAATLSAGTGIAITNGHNTITIASTGSEQAWTDEGTSFNAAAGNGYFITAAATATLPASPTQGNEISFIVDAAATLTITANTGQVIRIGAAVSASAGTAANNARGDAVTLIYRSLDTAWIAKSVLGTWTVT